MLHVCHAFMSLHCSLVVACWERLTSWHSCMWYFIVFWSLSLVVSWVRCRAWFYRFLIFAILTFIMTHKCAMNVWLIQINTWICYNHRRATSNNKNCKISLYKSYHCKVLIWSYWCLLLFSDRSRTYHFWCRILSYIFEWSSWHDAGWSSAFQEKHKLCSFSQWFKISVW